MHRQDPAFLWWPCAPPSHSAPLLHLLPRARALGLFVPQPKEATPSASTTSALELATGARGERRQCSSRTPTRRLSGGVTSAQMFWPAWMAHRDFFHDSLWGNVFLVFFPHVCLLGRSRCAGSACEPAIETFPRPREAEPSPVQAAVPAGTPRGNLLAPRANAPYILPKNIHLSIWRDNLRSVKLESPSSCCVGMPGTRICLQKFDLPSMREVLPLAVAEGPLAQGIVMEAGSSRCVQAVSRRTLE